MLEGKRLIDDDSQTTSKEVMGQYPRSLSVARNSLIVILKRSLEHEWYS